MPPPPVRGMRNPTIRRSAAVVAVVSWAAVMGLVGYSLYGNPSEQEARKHRLPQPPEGRPRVRDSNRRGPMVVTEDGAAHNQFADIQAHAKALRDAKSAAQKAAAEKR
jgi:hypothetical protein